MRWITVTILAFTCSAAAQDASVELAGVAVSRGMSADEVRSVLPVESIQQFFQTGDQLHFGVEE